MEYEEEEEAEVPPTWKAWTEYMWKDEPLPFEKTEIDDDLIDHDIGDPVNDVTTLRVGDTVEVSCPMCEAPISAWVSDVSSSNFDVHSPEKKKYLTYVIQHKACDCPLIAMY